MSELEKRLMKHIDLLVERYPSLESEKNSIISAYLLFEECYVHALIVVNGPSISIELSMFCKRRFNLEKPRSSSSIIKTFMILIRLEV